MSVVEPYRVLPFEPSHRAGVVALAEEILCREYGVVKDLLAEDDLKDPAASYPAPRSRFLVAKSEGTVIGTGGIHWLSGDDCELRRLYVLAARRREGIASALVAELISFVRQQEFRRIYLEVRPEMKATIKGYARYGFMPVKAGEKTPRPGEFLAIHL